MTTDERPPVRHCKTIRAFRRQRRGAAATEYGLLVGLVALALLGAAVALGADMGTLFDRARNGMSDGTALVPPHLNSVQRDAEPMAQWQAGPWRDGSGSSCSAGGSQPQQRDVTCQKDGAVVDDSACSGAKPDSSGSRACDTACPALTAGDWLFATGGNGGTVDGGWSPRSGDWLSAARRLCESAHASACAVYTEDGRSDYAVYYAAPGATATVGANPDEGTDGHRYFAATCGSVP